MRLFYRITAEIVFIIHIGILFMVLFGWIWPNMWKTYMLTILVVMISDVVFGLCLMSKWEFDLRKKVNPHLNYNYSWITYYMHKIISYRLSDVFYSRVAIFFLASSFVINIYFHYFFV